ncbi:MAG: hypothetical protein WCK90_02815 [archaeon]
MDEEEIIVENPVPVGMVSTEKVGQDQVHGLLFSENLGWKDIIYDLINTEQLDPWDIDLSLLAQKYLEKVKLLDEANFFISSKVLFAAALLLRLKSEILLYDYIPSLDDILFGKKEDKKYVQERIFLDDEIPGLVLKTPLPRFRKVSLEELMSALGKAINTENRRIKKVIVAKQQEIETALSLPKRRINIQDDIKDIYEKLQKIFSEREHKLPFSHISGTTKEERVAAFLPLLHLDNQNKVWLEQEAHFEEIWILLQHLYEKHNSELLDRMRVDVEEALKQEVIETPLTEEEQARVESIENDFQNPLGEPVFKMDRIEIDDGEEDQ